MGNPIPRNCLNCNNLGSDGDGPEYNGSWPVCTADRPRANLRSFPFKKDQPCHEPGFWQYIDLDEGLKAAFDGEVKTLDDGCWPEKTLAMFKEKYLAAAQPSPGGETGT